MSARRPPIARRAARALVSRLAALGRRAGVRVEVRDRRPSTRYVGPSPEQRRATILAHNSVDLVIDVGANAGQYAVEAREHGYAGRIVSFEPVSSAFVRLQAASAADPAWSCRRVALGDRDDEVTINVSANEAKSSSVLPQRDLDFGTLATMRYVERERVPMTTLDHLATELLRGVRRPLLKLDVQGLELAVLRGAEVTLPALRVVEAELSLLPLYEGQPGWREVVDHLDDAGFELLALEPAYSDWETGRVVEVDALFLNRREPSPVA